MGIAWFVIGLALWASDNAAGYVFFILGLAWMSGTIGREGESWTDRQPGIARWLFGGLFVLSVLAAIGILVLTKCR